MGLAGRKSKQRIGADPRNLTWSDDSSKFGAKYLQSLGWSAGTGLGVSGEGRTSNLKIHQKLDLMGIGANRRPGGDDAGWRGGREFDGLLARLNQLQSEDTRVAPVYGGSISQDSGEAEAEGKEEEMDLEKGDRAKEKGEKKKRKRTSGQGDDEIDAKEAKRRRKEEKRERKEEKRERKERKKAEKAAKKLKGRNGQDSEDGENQAVAVTEPPAANGGTEVAVKATPRYRAHRARHLASKRLAASSTTGMNEILGIAASAPSAAQQTLGISSIPFPTQVTPPGQGLGSQTEGDAGEDCAPGLGLTRVRNRLEQDQDAEVGLGGIGSTRSFGMGLGLGVHPGGGLGFGGAKEQKENDSHGEDILRKSGKSVAEYFAEKMRVKNAMREAPAPALLVEETGAGKGEELQRKKGRKERK